VSLASFKGKEPMTFPSSPYCVPYEYERKISDRTRNVNKENLEYENEVTRVKSKEMMILRKSLIQVSEKILIVRK
jgi:hypothetical protein